jgi:diguanylate cyclase (GGDEF)-like protein
MNDQPDDASEFLSAIAMQPQRPPCLLVVDDQPINIQTIYQTFCEDHQVLMATSGAAAMQICKSKRPDLILLDVMMPDMDGYALCRWLKQDAQLRDIPVMFVTARHDELAETLALDVGAVDFISKPINTRILRARVKTHLALKSQRDLLRSLAYLDGLTAIFNRRFFDERLAMEWSRSGRNGAPISVILIDVDHFKRYNDCYGHLAGDACLRTVARRLKENLHRPADLVARYGGEEFGCILPETDLKGAMQLAAQLQNAVLKQQIPHADSPVTTCVTVSLGVASTEGPHDGRSTAGLLALADTMLYRSKSDGRNRSTGAELSR